MILLPSRVFGLLKVAGSRLSISAATGPHFVCDQPSRVDLVLHPCSLDALRQAWIQNMW
jgi:hypothetical protein